MNRLRVNEILREIGIAQKDFASKLGMTDLGFSKSINEKGNTGLNRLNHHLYDTIAKREDKRIKSLG